MTFNSLILIWFDGNKRNLPWRNTREPYQIWLSEIILQQTRVVQGTNYYYAFVEKFPRIEDLAKAEEQEILRLWQGLGYYSRARNLHFTAKHIVNELNGQFPRSFQELLKLKGVGEYTAAAIASIAFGEPVPAVDGNVFRVFSRYFNIHLDISLPKTKKYFFELGKEVISPNRPGDFNQAVMELGATICTPRNPKCGVCPVNESCEALRQNTIGLLPVKSKKQEVRKRNFHFLELTDGENFLLKKRTEKDVWHNLYNFPLVETFDNNEPEPHFSFLTHGAKTEKTFEELHVLTHQKLKITFWRAVLDKTRLEQLSEKLGAEMVSARTVNEFPLPRPMEKYLNEIV